MASQEQRYQSALGEAKSRYQSMISDLTTAKEAARKEIASEYGEVADIYRTGGEYGAGAISRIQETAKQNLAASQANLVSTGMSSGSMALGARARYSRDVTQGIQDVEDIRYERLGAALQAVGQAREARGARIAGVYTTSAEAISQFRQPTTSEFANQEELTKMETQASLAATRMQTSTQRAIAQANIQSAANLQAAQISSQQQMQSRQLDYLKSKDTYGSQQSSGQIYF
jgi:hypothetical protein